MNALTLATSAFILLCAAAMAAEPASEPVALSRLRSTFFDRQADALLPVQRWYVEELQRLERALAQSGDIVAAAKVREERTEIEQPTLFIVKATWGTKEKTTDITRKLQTLVRANSLDATAGDHLSDIDPAPGLNKQVIVTFRRGGKERTVTVKQFDRIHLP